MVVVPILITWASTPSYEVAFSGLTEEDAGNIVQKLQESGISYKLQGVGTILVQTDKVYEVRLSMAREGLPAGGNVGMEIFSGNTLGMTEFTQKVNYQRALEGELEKTIGSLDAVQGVRVHIVTPEKALLADEQMPTTASITIQEKPSQKLDQAQVRAITFLVGNSVEGLDPANVVVVDTEGNLLASGAGDDSSAAAISQVDGRRAAELAAGADIQKKVKNLLDTALGPNRSVVQVNVNMDWTEREVKTQTFDPTPGAVRSSQKLNEAYTTDGTTVGGIPGASSNLPTAVATVTVDQNGNVIYSRSEETTNYEITSTEQHDVVPAGQLQRVSLSVLVDGVSDETQLQTLQAAIAAAAGIDQNRGDILSVQTLEFDKTYSTTQTEALAEAEKTDWITRGVEIGLIALVTILLMWYVSRLLRNIRMASADVWTPVMRPVSEMALPSPSAAATLQLSSAVSKPAGLPEVSQVSEQVQPPMPAISPTLQQMVKSSQPKGPAPTQEEEQMQRVVARLADENPASVAEIIQLWLNEDKKNNG
jgi:flagellar M-ring protein FliF